MEKILRFDEVQKHQESKGAEFTWEGGFLRMLPS